MGNTFHFISVLLRCYKRVSTVPIYFHKQYRSQDDNSPHLPCRVLCQNLPTVSTTIFKIFSVLVYLLILLIRSVLILYTASYIRG
ncbi:hypothetical protein 7t3_0141 [Salmonella phage 7t3]|nr:hypothetical protein 7t3_0141 [Salmonella phage 7t3]